MTYDPQQQGGPPYPSWPTPSPTPSPPPPAVLAYDTPLAPRKPVSVTVLAIIGIVLASFWILVGLMGIFQLVFTIAMMRRFTTAGMAGFETVLRFQAFLSVGGGIIGAALLTMSIGCLRLAPWARRGIIFVALVDLVFILGKVAVTLAWIIPAQQSAVTSLSTVPLPAASTAMTSVQATLAAGQAIIMSIFPIFVLVFMTKARIKHAFDQQLY
jgi:hypothetical protein